MKYLFAFSLVVAAFFSIFNSEKLIPATKTLGFLANSKIASLLPFHFKITYAQTQLQELRREQVQLRNQLASVAVDQKDRQSRIKRLQEKRNQSLAQLRHLTMSEPETQTRELKRQVRYHESIDSQLNMLSNQHQSLALTIEHLETIDEKLEEQTQRLHHRIEQLTLTHTKNQALGRLSKLNNKSITPNYQQPPINRMRKRESHLFKL